VAISTLIFRTENNTNVDYVMVWQVSAVLEQEGCKLEHSKFGVTFLVVVWLLSLVFIRQFYNSSLYSFFTADRDPHDFPSSIEEVLNRGDVSLISSWAFLSSLIDAGFSKDFPLKMVNFY